MKKNILVVVGSKSEAQEALGMAGRNAIYIATTLEAEFFLEKHLSNYKNPLYSILQTVHKKNTKDYVFDNFKIAYEYCSAEYLRYFRDRFGYFLAELDRSIDLAEAAVRRYHPRIIYIGEIKNYPGASVVDGTLKTNAFFLVAKKGKIKCRVIHVNEKSFSIKQKIGRQIQYLRFLNKQTLDSECDLLILATPSHLIKMSPFIDDLKKRGLKVTLLTYSLTQSLRDEMGNHFSHYLEKEKLVDSKIKNAATLLKKALVQKKVWNNFEDKKFSRNPIFLRYVRLKIEDIIKNEIDSVFQDIFLSEKVLSSLAPQALIVTTDPDTKILPYVDKAKQMGLKTICLQHGAFYGQDSPAIYPVSEFFIAWSKLSRDWLQKTSYFKKVKMFAGKSSFHNKMTPFNKPGIKKTFTLLFLATKQPTVDKGLVMFYLRSLFLKLSGVKNLRLIVRLHPYQNDSNLKSLMENFEINANFENQTPLAEALEKADIIIYENTSAGFDAMLSGKPTIYYNPYNSRDYFNVQAHSASLAILTKRDLDDKLGQFISNDMLWKKYSASGRIFAKKYLGLDKPTSQLTKTVKTILNQ